MIIKPMLKGLFAALLTFSLSSCFEQNVTITLNPDGSGSLVEEFLFSEQATASLKEMQNKKPAEGDKEGEDLGLAAKDPLEEMLDKQKAEARAKELGEGDTLKSIDRLDKDGRMGVKIIYDFTHVDKLKIDLGKILSPPGEEMAAKDNVPQELLGITFKDKQLTLKFPEPKSDAPEAPDGAEEEDGMAAAAQMFKGMKMNLVLKAKDGIAETDATHAKDDTVTLISMNFDELVTNEGGIKNMKKLEAKNREALKAADQLKGYDVETKEQISIKLK